MVKLQTELLKHFIWEISLVRMGKTQKKFKSRVAKGMGIVTEIMDILNTVSFGAKYFEIAGGQITT